LCAFRFFSKFKGSPAAVLDLAVLRSNDLRKALEVQNDVLCHSSQLAKVFLPRSICVVIVIEGRLGA